MGAEFGPEVDKSREYPGEMLAVWCLEFVDNMNSEIPCDKTVQRFLNYLEGAMVADRLFGPANVSAETRCRIERSHWGF